MLNGVRCGTQHRRLLIGAMCTLWATAGCSLFGASDDASEPPKPDSDVPLQSVRETAGEVSLAPPKEWKTLPRNELRGTISWAVQHHEDDEPVAEIAVSDDVERSTDTESAAKDLATNISSATADFTEQNAGPIDVRGADQAYRIDYTYEAVDGQGNPTGITIIGADITIDTGDHHQSLVRITGQQDAVAPATIDRIVDTIRLDTTQR